MIVFVSSYAFDFVPLSRFQKKGVQRNGGAYSMAALISVVCLCVLGSRGSGPPGLGPPQGPGLAIFGPKPCEFIGCGVAQGSKPYEFNRVCLGQVCVSSAGL